MHSVQFEASFKMGRKDGKKKRKVRSKLERKDGKKKRKDSFEKNDDQMTDFDAAYEALVKESCEHLYHQSQKLPEFTVGGDGKKTPSSLFVLSCEAVRKDVLLKRFSKWFQTPKQDREQEWFEETADIMEMTEEDIKKKLAEIPV